MNGLDVAVFRAVNGWPDSQAPFWVFLTNATKTTVGLILVGVLFLALVAWRPTRKPALLSMLAWPLANTVCDVLKDAFRAPRPSWPELLRTYPDFQVRVEPLTSFGTASAHAANMMAVAVCFLWGYRPVGYFWLAVALLVGLSRVYVGVHWPSQVLLGWLCGALAGTIVWKSAEAAARLYGRRRAQDESRAEVP